MTDINNPQQDPDALPRPVVNALRRRYGPDIDVPNDVDSAVLADAMSHLSNVSKQPRRAMADRWRWAFGTLMVGSLAAAVLMLAVLPQARIPVVREGLQMADSELAEMPFPEKPDFTSDDVDHNGHVDILDAFALARNIQRGESNSFSWDQNGDGRLNQDDVDLVALNAVML